MSVLSLLERIDLKQDIINIDSVLNININNIYEYISEVSLNPLSDILQTLQNNLDNKQETITINSDLSINAVNVYYNNETIIDYIDNKYIYETIMVEGENNHLGQPIFSCGNGVPIDEEFGIPFYNKGIIERVNVLIVSNNSMTEDMSFTIVMKNTDISSNFTIDSDAQSRIQENKLLNLSMNTNENEFYILSQTNNIGNNIRYRFKFVIKYLLDQNTYSLNNVNSSQVNNVNSSQVNNVNSSQVNVKYFVLDI